MSFGMGPKDSNDSEKYVSFDNAMSPMNKRCTQVHPITHGEDTHTNATPKSPTRTKRWATEKKHAYVVARNNKACVRLISSADKSCTTFLHTTHAYVLATYTHKNTVLLLVETRKQLVSSLVKMRAKSMRRFLY